jgi:hypothetical protein
MCVCVCVCVCTVNPVTVYQTKCNYVKVLNIIVGTEKKKKKRMEIMWIDPWKSICKINFTLSQGLHNPGGAFLCHLQISSLLSWKEKFATGRKTNIILISVIIMFFLENCLQFLNLKLCQ